jgi:hypothetical protein
MYVFVSVCVYNMFGKKSNITCMYGGVGKKTLTEKSRPIGDALMPFLFLELTLAPLLSFAAAEHPIERPQNPLPSRRRRRRWLQGRPHWAVVRAVDA